MPRLACTPQRRRWKTVAVGLGMVLSLWGQSYGQGGFPQPRPLPDATSQPLSISLDDTESDPAATPQPGDFLAPPAAGQGAIDSLVTVDSIEQPVRRELLIRPLAGIEIQGNITIPEYAVLQHIRCRAKRLCSEQQIEEDVNALIRTRSFFSVRPLIRMTDAGPVLVFRLTERPILNSVTFEGNKHVKSRELEAHLGLMRGHAFDVATNKECVERIKSIYRDKGYRHAKVTLQKGGQPTDRDVLFVIEEGAKSKIWGIDFEGNSELNSQILKTKLATKRVILWWLGGDYDPYKVEGDALTLTKYYNDLGYFDARVTFDVREQEEKGKVYVVFKIQEGVRYQVRNVEITGNSVVSRSALQEKRHLNPGDKFNARFLRKDVEHMKGKYDELGRLFAKVQPTPKFLEQPGQVDLVYQIDEDQPYKIGSINVHIRGDHPHSQEFVVRNQVNPFLKPGISPAARIFAWQGRAWKAARSGTRPSVPWLMWRRPTPNSTGPSARLRSDRALMMSRRSMSFWPKMTPRSGFGHVHERRPSLRIRRSATSRLTPPPRGGAAPQPVAAPAVRDNQVIPAAAELPPQSNLQRRPTAQFAAVAVNTAPASHGPVDRALALSTAETRIAARNQAPGYTIDPEAIFSLGEPDLMTVRAQSPDETVRGQSIDRNGMPIPQNYFGGVSPQGDPYGDSFNRPPGEPGYVDVNIDVTEGRTGRLMFGVGVNSDAGLIGQFTLQEDNFDILRPPQSWADIVNGQAFRGRGQSFRLEAMPGNQVSRYLVSWQDPFFLQTDYNLGVSGFYYNRFYNEWTEDRLGGRISIGRLLSRYWSFNTSLRLENVDIRNFNLPARSHCWTSKGTTSCRRRKSRCRTTVAIPPSCRRMATCGKSPTSRASVSSPILGPRRHSASTSRSSSGRTDSESTSCHSGRSSAGRVTTRRSSRSTTPVVTRRSADSRSAASRPGNGVPRRRQLHDAQHARIHGADHGRRQHPRGRLHRLRNGRRKRVTEQLPVDRGRRTATHDPRDGTRSDCARLRRSADGTG